MTTSTSPKPPFRPDLQGLRAIAVLLVLAFHLRPSWVPGGFVGVDVFFVLSGFFITTSLVAEAAVDGRIHLRGFWARRIRRLMPAATAVLLAVLVATMTIAPLTTWTTTLWELVASATSWENWYLAAQSVDYLRADASPSPLRHFWSLGVEEQFYLVWPFLLLALATWAGRRRLTAWRIATVVLVLVFLVVSVVETQLSPATAYYSTASRAWELLIGAGIALGAGRIRIGGRAALALLVAGAAAIAASAVVISSALPFPSATALLPTLGAAAIILSGFGPRPGWATAALTWRPVRYVGDISYSLYLWHWPVIVFATMFVGVGGALPAAWAAAAAAVSIVLAIVSYEFVERPFLGRTRFPQRPRFAPEPRSARSIAAAYRLGAILLAGTLVAVAVGALNQQRAFAQLEADRDPANFPGARVLDPDFDPRGWNLRPVAPTPDAQQLEHMDRQFLSECLSELLSVRLKQCDWGDPSGDRLVIVAGDSHAAQWLPALDAIARDRGWRIEFFGHQYCTLTTEDAPYWLDRPGFEFTECADWNRALIDAIVAERPDLVVHAALAYGQPDWLDMSREDYAMRKPDGYARAWRALLEAGIPVVAIDETPQPSGVSLPDCVARPFADPAACVAPAIPTDHWDDRLRIASSLEPRVPIIVADELICPGGECPAAIGNVLVFRDSTHLTAPYAASLAWFVERELAAAAPFLFEDGAATRD